MSKKLSLRKRLLTTLMILIGVTWLGTFVLVIKDARHELKEIYDASLAQNARIFFGLLKQGIQRGEIELIRDIALSSGTRRPYELNLAFWADLGHKVLHSQNAPDFLTELPVGFSNYTVDGKKWRVYTLRDSETGLVIHAAQQYEAREALIAYLIRDSLFAILLILPLLGLFIWLGIGRSLKPLKQLVNEAGSMTPDTLRPFNLEHSPEEVTPLILALNKLLERLDRAIESERRFTSDAAHELRTPLAGLKVQLQVALRAGNMEQKTTAMNKAVAGIDRLTHLVNQLLTLARADRESPSTLTFQPVDLVAIAEEVLGASRENAKRHDITLSFNPETTASTLRCEPTMIQIAIRNLLENAIKYTPAPGQVDLEIQTTNGQIAVFVRDSGGGIPNETLDLMFQRFRRGEQSGYSGSGLGLSIVKRIAELHNAEVIVDNSPSSAGFRIGILFPKNS